MLASDKQVLDFIWNLDFIWILNFRFYILSIITHRRTISLITLKLWFLHYFYNFTEPKAESIQIYEKTSPHSIYRSNQFFNDCPVVLAESITAGK